MIGAMSWRVRLLAGWYSYSTSTSVPLLLGTRTRLLYEYEFGSSSGISSV